MIHKLVQVIVDNPDFAAALIVASLAFNAINVVLLCITDSKIGSIAKQLRAQGINVWENK